jgi:hypothetical protein
MSYVTWRRVVTPTCCSLCDTPLVCYVMEETEKGCACVGNYSIKNNIRALMFRGTARTTHGSRKIPIMTKLFEPHNALKAKHVCGSGGIAPSLFTSAVAGGEWSASRPGSFTPRKKPPPPPYPLDRWLGGPQSRYGRCGKEKNILPPAGN